MVYGPLDDGKMERSPRNVIVDMVFGLMNYCGGYVYRAIYSYNQWLCIKLCSIGKAQFDVKSGSMIMTMINAVIVTLN
jgi:hypothetical protein